MPWRGEPERAMALASEGLTVARRLGAPSFLALNLVALAAASAEEDPDRANALLPRERCAPRPPRPRNLESLHAGRHRQRAYRRLAANCLRSCPRRSARCTGPATDRSSPPSSTTSLLGRSSPPTPRPPRRSKAPHAALVTGEAHHAQQQHQTSRRGSWNHRPASTRSISSRHCAARPRVNLSDQLGDARLHELRVQGGAMDDDHAVSPRAHRNQPRTPAAAKPPRGLSYTARDASDCAGPDSLWDRRLFWGPGPGKQHCIPICLVDLRLAPFVGGGRCGGVAVGDGHVLVHRSRGFDAPVGGASRGDARRPWPATTRSCAARSSPRRLVVKTTGDGFHAAFATASRCGGRPRSTRSAARRESWVRRARCGCGWVCIPARRSIRDGDYYGTAVNRAAG